MITFLQAAIGYYQSVTVTVKGTMTDIGSWYTFRVFREARAMLDIRRICNRLYAPRANDKAEHFIQAECRESK